MPTDTRELRVARQKKVEEIRALIDKADEGSRALSASERKKCDSLQREVDDETRNIAEIEARNRVEIEKQHKWMMQQLGGNMPQSRFGAGATGDEEHRYVFFDETGQECRSLLQNEPLAGAHPLEPGKVRGADVITAMVTDRWSEETRAAYSEGATAAGGYLFTAAQSAQVFDLARAKSVVAAAGAQTVEMNTEVLQFARVETRPTAYWTSENAQITESEGTFGAVQLRARALAIYAKASRQLLADASNARQVVEQTIADAIALKLDESFLNGSGNGESPTGLLYSADVAATNIGGAMTIDILMDSLKSQWDLDYDPDTLIWSPAMRNYVEQLKDGDGQYLLRAAPDPIVNLRKLMSSQVGSRDANENMYVGNFNNTVIGIRSPLEVRISDEGAALMQRNQVAIAAVIRADYVCGQANAVRRLHGITGT